MIVVGARCAGSPTAMLLARKGYRVLLVDRATFPSDTISTHLIHPPGVAALQRWGLLDRVVGDRLPADPHLLLRLRAVHDHRSPRPIDGIREAYCPRRTVLDKLLVDAAADAGAEVREGFTVDELLVEDGTRHRHPRARPQAARPSPSAPSVVIGADGRNSLVAKAVQPEQYNEKPRMLAGYYTYWSGLPMDGRFEIYIRAEPWRSRRVPDQRRPHAGHRRLAVRGVRGQQGATSRATTSRMLDLVPAVRRADAAPPAARSASSAWPCPTTSASPYGPGWALVGDAGYNKDFITAQGISDAFRDAELCADALDERFSGVALLRGRDGATTSRARTEHVLPMYEFTARARDPPAPAARDRSSCSRRSHGNQEAMDAFARVNAGVTSPAEFFSEENVRRILAAAR